jgi:hypothetical protein
MHPSDLIFFFSSSVKRSWASVPPVGRTKQGGGTGRELYLKRRLGEQVSELLEGYMEGGFRSVDHWVERGG